MRVGIDKKVNLVSVSVILILGSFLGFYFIQHETRALNSELDERATVLLNSLSANSEYPILIRDRAAISRLAKGVLTQKDVAFCRIEDIDGTLLLEGGSKRGKSIREFASTIVTKRVAEEMSEELILGAPSEAEEEIGKIYLAVSLSGLNQKVRDIKKTVAVFVIASMVLASIASSLLLKLILSGPITMLVRGTERIARGDLKYEVPVKSNDEIGILAASFNRMTEDLSRTLVSKNYVDNVIKSMADSLIVTDSEGRIKTMNQATEDLLGYSEDELIGKPAGMLLGEESFKEILTDLMEKGAVNNAENFYVAKDGSKIPMSFSGSVMYDGNNKIQGIVCVAQDITERKRAEEALQRQLEVEERITRELAEKTEGLSRSNEELNTLVYAIAHDVKAHAVSFQILSSLLTNEYGDTIDKNGRMYIDRIRKNSEHIGILIEDILELSKIGRAKGREESVDISDLISSVADELAPQLEARGTRLIVRDGMPTIKCDRSRMSQIFANLISNAIKFMGGDNEDPTIEVGYDDQNSYHTFYVRDNGIGIDEKYHEKIFQILQRLNDIETQGTGVGLAIVKKIVENSGGEIWVDSAEGKGTTMYFTVPKANDAS
jgi:PAS domain S-box-containing protein